MNITADELKGLLDSAEAVVSEFTDRTVRWIDAGHAFVPLTWVGWPKQVVIDCYLLAIATEKSPDLRELLSASMLSIAKARPDLVSPIPIGITRPISPKSLADLDKELKTRLPHERASIVEMQTLLDLGREASSGRNDARTLKPLVAAIAAHHAAGLL